MNKICRLYTIYTRKNPPSFKPASGYSQASEYFSSEYASMHFSAIFEVSDHKNMAP
jgi:hypothetical protein